MNFLAHAFGGGLPPAAIEAEQAIVGAILRNNRRFDAIADMLREEHFVDPICRRIFADAARRIGRGETVDGVTLRAAFEAEGVLDEVGGVGYFADLMAIQALPVELSTYATLIVDTWCRRRIAEIAQDATARAFAQRDEDRGDTIASDLAGELLAIADGGAKATSVHVGDAAMQALREAEEARKAGGRPRGVPTGLMSLDALLGGLAPGQLVVLGARPAVGKTALALSMALAAARAGVGTAIFSLEMSAEELGQRLLANLTGIPSTAIRDGRLAQVEFDRLMEAQHQLAGLPLHIDDTPGLTIERIRLRIRAMHRKAPVGLVIVDHLGLLGVPAGTEKAGLVTQTEANSKASKALAKEMRLPVLALSQLNRALEARDDKRPGLADLRWSGSIEQDADAVMFLHREEVFLRDREPARRSDESPDKHAARLADHAAAVAAVQGRGELIIAKQRRGPTGTIPIGFDGARSTITDLGAGDRP